MCENKYRLVFNVTAFIVNKFESYLMFFTGERITPKVKNSLLFLYFNKSNLRKKMICLVYKEYEKHCNSWRQYAKSIFVLLLYSREKKKFFKDNKSYVCVL